MGDSDTEKGLVDVGSHGRLSVAPNSAAPLLVVFGGIDVGGRHSGVYMWEYLADARARFHVFVATSNTVDGDDATRALAAALKDKGGAPPSQILYLFSGGYRPGMQVLRAGGRTLYSAIFLVDIWMGVTERSGSVVPDFYKALANELGSKLTYVYTSFGANNSAARDYIAARVGKAVLVNGSGMSVHMSTNRTAVGLLP